MINKHFSKLIPTKNNLKPPISHSFIILIPKLKSNQLFLNIL
jgi:hypothetical protein